MNKIFIIIALFIFVCIKGDAQQLPYTSPIQNVHHLWNPAFTAPGVNAEVSGFFRKQWVGFDNSPSTAFVSMQYPFVDMNMSAAAAIISDVTGPVSKLGIQLNYAYKLRELLKDDDHLAIGINGYFYQYRFDPSKEVYSDLSDPLIDNSSSQSKFTPNVGFGLAYFSKTEEFDGEDIFYIGASYQQYLESDLVLESGNAPRQKHLFLNIGNKFFGYDYYLEPSVQINFTRPELIDIVLSAKYEMEETFWAGMHYSTVTDFGFQGGVILEDVGGRYTSMRLGTIASINSAIITGGPTFEFYAAYVFDVD